MARQPVKPDDVLRRVAPDDAREAGGKVYVVTTDHTRAYKIEDLDVVPVTFEELTAVFGQPGEAVIRISNQI